MGKHPTSRRARQGVTALQTFVEEALRRRAQTAQMTLPAGGRSRTPPWLAALASLCVGAELGAGVMYFADPHAGRGRRHRFRDRSVHALRRLQDHTEAMAADLRNRAWGMVLRWRTRALHGCEVGDDVLEARVRAAIGHVVHHPRAVHVTALDGEVLLTGVLPERLIAQVLACVKTVPGAHDVVNHLLANEAHEPATRGSTGPERVK